MKNDTNILAYGQEVANAAMSILNKFGKEKSGPGRGRFEVRTNAGSIQREVFKVIRIGPKIDTEYPNFINLYGELYGGTFTEQRVSKDVEEAGRILERIGLNLANKIPGG
jgi:hypothetical protein